MAALDELHHQCERRGWRILLTGTSHYPDGSPGPGSLPAMLIDGLEVRGRRDDFAGRNRELLARVAFDSTGGHIDFDSAAVELARALASQGLIQ